MTLTKEKRSLFCVAKMLGASTDWETQRCNSIYLYLNTALTITTYLDALYGIIVCLILTACLNIMVLSKTNQLLLFI